MLLESCDALVSIHLRRVKASVSCGSPCRTRLHGLIVKTRGPNVKTPLLFVSFNHATATVPSSQTLSRTTAGATGKNCK